MTPSELKLASKYRAFEWLLVSSATATTLIRLALLIERKDHQGFRRLMSELDPRLEVRNGETARVDWQFEIVLPDVVLPALANHFRELAGGAEFSEFRLSEVDRELAAHSELDWLVRRLEYRGTPTRDYRPEPDGAEWEAVMFHDPVSARVLQAAWREIVAWSVQNDPEHTEMLYLSLGDPDREPEEHPPEAAFALFLERDAAFQVSGYRRVPFRLRYGESLDWIQVWFEEDRIVLIVQDHLAETGSFDWDVENFFGYRALVKAISRSVGASRFAWRICAEGADPSEALEIGALDDIEALWGLFKRSANPDRSAARAKFEAAFAAGTIQQ